MEHQAVRVDGDVRALALHVRRSERDREVAVRNVALHRAVGRLVLEEDDRVRIADGRAQHAGDVLRRARHDHLQPGHVRVERLERLRVVERAMNTRAPRHPDDDRHMPLPIRAIPDARGLVDDLLERRCAEVRELHLGDRDESRDRRADRDADDVGLRERHVDDPIGPELLDEPVGHAEHPAAHADVLAEDDDPLVAPELVPKGVVDRLHVALLGHAPPRRRSGKSCGRRSRMIAYAASTICSRFGFTK